MNILDFYRPFAAPSDLVFDVGANVGSRTEVFSRRGCKVVAIEPLEAVYAVLWTVFQFNPNVIPVKKACGSGAEPPYAKIMEYDPSAPLAGISSMSEAWIGAVKETNRFHQSDDKWATVLMTEMTTLDKLIAEFGVPAFIKIDVEGYEKEVLAGLSQPVRALCFEFTPERLADTSACIDRCIELGMASFCFSVKESFELSDWTDGESVKRSLARFAGDNVTYGDVYART